MQDVGIDIVATSTHSFFLCPQTDKSMIRDTK